MGRSSIAVSDEIASELSRVASNRNQTSFALANSCLGAALRTCKEGGDIDEIYPAWKVNKIGKEIRSFEFMGKELLERMIHDLDQDNREKALNIWKDAGRNFGVFFQLCFPTIEDVVTLTEQLRKVGTAGEIRLVEQKPVYGEEEQHFVFTYRSSFNSETLAYISQYVSGFLGAYGLSLLDSKITELGAFRITCVGPRKLTKEESLVLR